MLVVLKDYYKQLEKDQQLERNQFASALAIVPLIDLKVLVVYIDGGRDHSAKYASV